MRLTIGAETLRAIGEQAQTGYPEEVCGALLGEAQSDGTISVTAAVALNNSRADERRRRYLVGPDDVLALEKRAFAAGLSVVGYYHSHPDSPAVPSEFDREQGWPWYTYLIVSVAEARMSDARAWRLSDDRERFLEMAVERRDGIKIEAERG